MILCSGKNIISVTDLFLKYSTHYFSAEIFKLFVSCTAFSSILLCIYNKTYHRENS